MENENIEKILNMKKIRYEYMDELFGKFKKIFVKEGVVNVFIDLPSMIKQLYNPKNIEFLSNSINKRDKYCIASCLLNMISHYRHYFASRWENYTNFYFMYNSKIDKDIIDNYDINYKKTYYEKRISQQNEVFGSINASIKDNYKILSIIIKYIPNAWFIDTKYIDYRSIFPYINKNVSDESDLNVIITTDKIFYQSVIYDNTLILEPRAENSKIVYYNNAVRNLIDKLKNNKTFKNNPGYLNLNPENITILNALVTQKDYDIKGIKNMGYTKAITFLNKNDIDVDTFITNSKSIIDIFKDILDETEIKELIKNYSIFNNHMIMEKNERKLEVLINLDDYIYQPEELKKVNDKYFKKYPLLLDFMFEGE